jgi:hypothetical protein
LNPSQPTSPGSQSVIGAASEDDINCFDNDDDIFSPSDPSPTHHSTLDGDSNVDQSIEQPTSLVNTNVKDVSDEITGNGEGIPSRPKQDGNASGQEEGDSDFEFVAEDVETDSDSETDLSRQTSRLARRWQELRLVFMIPFNRIAPWRKTSWKIHGAVSVTAK